ncbi:MAG: HAD family hydrolase [Candidatus Anstonellaceae archaeon]
MIKGMIFDLDNTLINFWEFKQKSVLSAAKVIKDSKLLNKNLEEIFDGIFSIYYSKGTDYQYAINDYLSQFKISSKEHKKVLNLAVQAYKKTKENILHPYLGITDMLEELKNDGYTLAVLSDATLEHVHNRLKKCNLFHYFDFIGTFDQTNAFKPSPKPFLKILSEMKLQPKEVGMVGDNPSRDIKGAKALKLTTFFALWGFVYGDDGTKADFVLSSPSDLPRILKRLNSINL